MSMSKERSNTIKLKACEKHLFSGALTLSGHAAQYGCSNCGGMMRLHDINLYIQGFVAAGGSADEVWPGYGWKLVSCLAPTDDAFGSSRAALQSAEPTP